MSQVVQDFSHQQCNPFFASSFEDPESGLMSGLTSYPQNDNWGELSIGFPQAEKGKKITTSKNNNKSKQDKKNQIDTRETKTAKSNCFARIFRLLRFGCFRK